MHPAGAGPDSHTNRSADGNSYSDCYCHRYYGAHIHIRSNRSRDAITRADAHTNTNRTTTDSYAHHASYVYTKPCSDRYC